MNHDQLLPASKLNASYLENIWLKRKVYAFVVTSFALFSVLILSWSINVRAVRVDNDMRFRLDDTSDTGVEQFKSVLLDAMQHATSDSHLVTRITELREQEVLDSPHIGRADLDSIRSKIQVYTKFKPGSSEASVKLSFYGNGSEGECRFVQRLSEDVLAFLRLTDGIPNMDAAIADVSTHLKKHAVNQDRFSSSLKSMVNDVETRIATIDSRMRNVWQNNQAPAMETLAATNLRARRNELARLETQRDEMRLNFNADAGSLQRLNDQITNIRRDIEHLEASSSGLAGARNTPFHNASFAKNTHAGTVTPVEAELLSDLSQDISSIQFSSLVASIDKIDQHRRQNLNAPIEFLDELSGRLTMSPESDPAVSLLAPGTVGTRPVGGKPAGAQMVILTFLAMAFGSVVVWHLNPKEQDSGFADIEAMSKTLGVPVVDQFPLKSPRESAKQMTMPVRLVKICESVALIMLLVVVVSCLLSSEVRTAMLENPLEGLSRIVWQFRKLS